MLRKTRVCLLARRSKPGYLPLDSVSEKRGSLFGWFSGALRHSGWVRARQQHLPTSFWFSQERKSREKKDAQNKDCVITSFEAKALLLSSMRFESEICL